MTLKDLVRAGFSVRQGRGLLTAGLGSGGGAGAGAAVVRRFPFAFDTPGLLTGATVYTPTIGDVLLDAWIEVTTAWDGTTPFGDMGSFVSQNAGWFSFANSALDMTTADTTNNWFEPPLLSQANGAIRKSSLLSQAALADNALATILRAVPGKFVTTDPLKVCVSQDGTNTGADPASTQGAAVLYLVTVTPV